MAVWPQEIGPLALKLSIFIVKAWNNWKKQLEVLTFFLCVFIISAMFM